MLDEQISGALSVCHSATAVVSTIFHSIHFKVPGIAQSDNSHDVELLINTRNGKDQWPAYHERLCDPMSTPSCWDKHEHLVSHAQANSSLQASSALLRHFWWATPFQIRARKERCSFDAKPGCPSSTTLQSAETLFDCKRPGHPQWNAESKRHMPQHMVKRSSACLALARSVDVWHLAAGKLTAFVLCAKVTGKCLL